MEPIIGIPENVLAQLMASHSALAQAEYWRNESYNNAHFAQKAEAALLQELEGSIGLDHLHRLIVRAGFLTEALLIAHGENP